jgi:hypothetical protein
VLREHVDAVGYEDEDQLKEWLKAAGVDDFSDRAFRQAISHLSSLGRLQAPRADRWQGPGPLVTWLVEPWPAIG